MTFDAIKATVKGHANLTSQEADTRIGESINRHYQRITASLGLDVSRFVTRSVSMTAGVRTVTFSQIEKIDRIIDTTDSTAIRTLREASVNSVRTMQPTEGPPSMWAPLSATSNSVTAVFDNLPQTAYSLQADGWATAAYLQGNDEPAFPESYHDILTWSVLAEELLKKEKAQLALTYEGKAEKLLSELRHFLADSHSRYDVARSGLSSSMVTGGGSGGGGNLGGTAYTQSALVTFDLGSGIAPFAVAQANAPVVTNLNADKLDDEDGSFYLDRSNHTGSQAIPVTDISPVTTDRLIGRDTAGSGAAEEIAVSGGIEFTGSTGIRTSAFTGDVTKAAGGTALTIAADAVTYAQMQNVAAASRLLGRGSAAGAGDPQELTVTSPLSISGTSLISDITTSIRQIVPVTPSGNFSTNSLTNVSVTNAAVTITTGASATVVVIATIPVRVGGGSTAFFDWSLDTVDDGVVQGAASTAGDQSVTLMRIATGLSAAAHTFQLRVRSNAGGTINIDMSAVAVGKIVAIEYR